VIGMFAGSSQEDRAQELEARALASRSLAEGQRLAAEAMRLRQQTNSGPSRAGYPFFRN